MVKYIDRHEEAVIDPKDLIIEPLERASTIPGSWYFDPEIYALELESVFASSWQVVASLEKLSAPGSRVVASIAGEPLIVVRGKDGELRVFYNVCRHRGGPLATEDGCESMLQCKYHGWTYALDGMLRGVPDFDRVELFDKKDFGLVEVPHAVWENFVFVNLNPSRSPKLDEIVTGISERTSNNPIKKKRLHTRERYNVRCNWKAYVDNYLEGYHVPIVHPELVKLYDFSQYKTDSFEWYSLQHSPLSANDRIYSTNAEEDSVKEALYYFIYPNLMLNILPGRLQTNLVVPTGPETCEVIFDYYYDDIDSDRTKEFIAQDIEFSHFVQLEDIEICELVQRGVRSRSYTRGRFSVKRENAVHHFQSLLKGALSATKP